MTSVTEKLRLEPIDGPPIEPVMIDGDQPQMLGRSSQCEVRLNHPAVSRRHVEIRFRGGVWFATDLGSRSGTILNESVLSDHRPTPLRDGQILRIRPWSFIVHTGGREHSTLTVMTTDDRRSTGQAIRGPTDSHVTRMAEQRLELLIETAGRVAAAKTESDLAQIVVDAAAQGSGYARASFIRSTGDEVEVLASSDASGSDHEMPFAEDAAFPSFSRSLLAAAGNGEMAVLDQHSAGQYGESIPRLEIHSALCAPVFLGDAIYGYLYLDARGRERKVHADANPFAQAVSRLLGLSLAGLKRQELQRSNERLLQDLGAAAEAQRLLLPPTSGSIGGVEYRMVMQPGQLVAGDLFNVIELPDHRIGVYIGDVTGHGIASAVLMTMTQTYLAGALKQHVDPAQALEEANRELLGRFPGSRFVTVWMGIIDPREQSLWFADAGHGYCLLLPGQGESCHWLQSAGSPPLAVTPSLKVENERIDFRPGSRLFLLSDGVIEQRSPEGEMFGADRVIQIARNAPGGMHVDHLLTALTTFAGTDRCEDDVTVALVHLP